MLITIQGHHLPGRTFCTPTGEPIQNVHVGVQVRREPADLVAGDADSAVWEVETRVVVDEDGQLDFRGPAVHGKRGERFLYLTWGDVGTDGSFDMFRRAKLMLNRIEPKVVQDAVHTGRMRARIDLTDGCGGPRCARVDPPALLWSAG